MRQQRYQRGVAVITALLLTTLAITIVASLFWQQQVQVRSIENQRLQLQKKWILRGALDWARLILREDAKHSTNEVDHLGEPWAVALAETRLDQYVENGRGDTEDSDANLSGQISDAQARYNLNNLAIDGAVDPREMKVFARLLANLRMEPALAQGVALNIARTQKKAATQGGTGIGNKPADPATPEVQFLRFTQVDDLLAIGGFTPEMLLRLKNFVTVLPRATSINVNTTTAEVLSARIEGLSMSDAAMMTARRDRGYFKDVADFKQNFPDKTAGLADKDVAMSTNFFIVNGKVRMKRSTLDVNALLERSQSSIKVLWVREN
ncbi:MAG: type II secretion system minor pseudopilin GspK [Burkholderiales bacterium]|nr:type II secretion system minor pseudopilin GspK [Burkholderiales bacterium]